MFLKNLAVLAVVLALALGGQVAYEQRDELAQRVPVLTPLLSALCQPLQCRIGPPRRIESITIEASAFSRLQPDAFRLQFTLANAASMPVALPALELTLTDTQDQAVIRRVLQPAELGSLFRRSVPMLAAVGALVGVHGLLRGFSPRGLALDLFLLVLVVAVVQLHQLWSTPALTPSHSVSKDGIALVLRGA